MRAKPKQCWQTIHASIRRWQLSPIVPLPHDICRVDATGAIQLAGGYTPIYSRDRGLVKLYGQWFGTAWFLDRYESLQADGRKPVAESALSSLPSSQADPKLPPDSAAHGEALNSISKPVLQTLDELIQTSPKIALEADDYCRLTTDEIRSMLRDCDEWPPPLGLSRAVFDYDPISGALHRSFYGGSYEPKRVRVSYSSSIPVTRKKNQMAARWVWYLHTGLWLDRRIVVTQVDDSNPYDLRFVNLQLQLRKGLKSKSAINTPSRQANQKLKKVKSKFAKWELQLKSWTRDYYLSASGHYREPPYQIYGEVYQYCPSTHDLVHRRLDSSWFESRRARDRYNKNICGTSAIIESVSGCKTVLFADREIFADRIVFSICMGVDLGDDAVVHIDGVASNIAFENLWRQACMNIGGTVLSRKVKTLHGGYSISELTQRDRDEPRYRVYRNGQYISRADSINEATRICEREGVANLDLLPEKYYGLRSVLN